MVLREEQLGLVVESLHAPLRDLAGFLAEAFGDTAIGLILYGKAASHEFDATRDTAQSVLVVKRVDLGALSRLATQGTKLGRNAIAAPLLMTPEYVNASLDTFPLELIDIQQRHIVLFGDDYFTPLEFREEHVRLQCERELKTALIALRQGLLASAGDAKMLAAVGGNVAQGLVRILRGLLWLKGERSPRPPRDLVELVEKRTDIRLPGVRRALDVKPPIDWGCFEALYADVAALGVAVDAW